MLILGSKNSSDNMQNDSMMTQEQGNRNGVKITHNNYNTAKWE